MMIRGQCNCGAATFEIRGDISDVYICHCSVCRRSTGGNGIAVFIVDGEQFRWTGGEDQVAHWKKPDDDWHNSFCRTCGSTLPGVNSDTSMYIPAGLLVEGGESLKVAAHFYVGSKAVWDEIGDNGQLYIEGMKTGVVND